MPAPFNINGWEFVVLAVLFLVLFGLLLKFAWNPILNALDAREKRIGDVAEVLVRDHLKTGLGLTAATLVCQPFAS